MAFINVTSEIGKLKTVMLHRPGEELLLLTPETLDELLFDDIPFLKNAQKEHDIFADILRNEGVKVLYLEDLVAETISNNPEIKEKFLRQYLSEANLYSEYYLDAVYNFLSNIKDNKTLVLKTMTGIKLNEVPIHNSDTLMGYLANRRPLLIDPMPNLYFTRDPFACVGNGVSLNRMYSVTRNRETIYGEYVFKYHPKYAGNVTLLYDRYDAPHIEGGDILNISNKVVAIGISQRTTPNAIDVFAKNAFFHTESEIETVLALDIPKSRAFMHLDTVFTQIDYDKFTIHPGIIGPLSVYEITKGSVEDELKIKSLDTTLEKILEKHTGVDKIDLIQCAGGDKIASEREQWNDGSNTLCIEPGTVLVYDRNDITNEILDRKGIKTLEMPCGELSRGRGGPRCMSMPFDREKL